MPLNVQCKRCANLRNDWCDKVHDSTDHDLIRDCQHYRTLTNADRIRAMSDEELAEWFDGELPSKPKEWWLDWLKKEVEE